jgi:hypothetical protein
MSKKKIYIKDWLLLKPYETQTLTDGYYLQLCNKVKQFLLPPNEPSVIQMYLEDEEIDLLACYLTSWFEDLVSGSNVWNTFIKVHKNLYNKPLPFYDSEEYFEGEINPQDISFLIWYFLNTVQDEKFISPFNHFIEECAFDVFQVFDDEWEYAPENKLIQSKYQINKNADFYQARNLIDTLLFKTYLFHTDTFSRLNEKIIELIEKSKDEQRTISLMNETRDQMVATSYSRLLSLKGKEWIAELLGQSHPLHNDYMNISQKILALFLYKGQDENDILLEHIATGKKFNLTKKSFDHAHDLIEIDTIVYIGLVKWQSEWWFSGIYFKQEFNADLVLDERNSVESRGAINFLTESEDKVSETLEAQYKAFLDFNNGEQIAFMASDKIMEFNNNYLQFFNNSLQLSDEEIEEARQLRIKDGLFEIKKEKEDPDFTKVAESGLVFFNPKSGIEIALAVNSAFPLPTNPFFNSKESEDHIFRLMMDESLSTELVMFCIENCKTKLPFFTKGTGKMYLKDIDFLLRFWKLGNYHSKPSITLV